MKGIINIILVEDNQDDCEVIVRGFKACECSHPIKWFQSSQAAIDYLQQYNVTQPHIVILDLNLPGIDGRSLLKIIKTDAKLQQIPVIILTTSSDEKDIKYCYENGANSYIQKPINFFKMKEVCKVISGYWFETCILPMSEDTLSM